MKKRDIFLVIAVVVFGITYNAIRRGDIAFYSGCSHGSRSLLDKNYLTIFPQEEIKFTESGTIKKIKLDNPAGDIEVEKSKDGTILIKPVIRVYQKYRKKINEIYKKVSVYKRKTGKKLVIEVDSEGKFPYQRVRVGFKCFIPEDVELDLKNRYGNIDIKDVGKNINIDERNGDFFAKNIDSRLKVKSHHGLVRLYDIMDRVQLYSNHSRIKIKNVPSLILKCAHANLNIYDVEDEVDITNIEHSYIEIEKANQLNINARHTKIKLRSISNGVKIKNSHAPIYMKDVTGRINIKARHCKISMDKIISDYLYIRNSHNYVDIKDITGKILDILLEHGGLEVEFNNIEEKIIIKTEHADVELKYPGHLHPSFNIVSNNGRIINRTVSELSVTKEKQKRLVNTLDGKPEVIIDTYYGDVVLKNSKKIPARETGMQLSEDSGESDN